MQFSRINFILLLFLFSGISVVYSQAKISYPADLDQLHQNIRNEILGGSVDPVQVQLLCDRLNSKGEWPDIDYTSKQRGDWPTAGHLGKLQSLAKAYQKPG